MKNTRTPARLVAAAGALAASLSLGLTSCGDEPETTPNTSDTEAEESAETTQAQSLQISDPWMKAAESGMTAAFGDLKNLGEEDITLSEVTTDVSAMVELHETVSKDGEMVMQRKEGGFTIAPGESHVLAPGGDHIMIMELSRPLEVGEEVPITLTMSDGSSLDITATVKNFTGAEEEYDEGEGRDMDMSEDSDK